MNNYCRNCGEKLENGMKICSKCNAEVFESRLNVEEKKEELIEYKKKEKQYIIIVISLFAVSFLLFRYFDNYKFILEIVPLISLGAIITLVYARITMNNSRKIKIMFNIFVSLIVIYFLFILITVMTCLGVFNRGCS